jgi:hypothetical protein
MEEAIGRYYDATLREMEALGEKSVERPYEANPEHLRYHRTHFGLLADIEAHHAPHFVTVISIGIAELRIEKDQAPSQSPATRG